MFKCIAMSTVLYGTASPAPVARVNESNRNKGKRNKKTGDCRLRFIEEGDAFW